ncbi:hypothetical protein JY97_10495 [Alkalispirochaeta odontotermitis]|nr:hypothetical protein JY97_10495 [Alkalispirochaeta odontotermitis]
MRPNFDLRFILIDYSINKKFGVVKKKMQLIKKTVSLILYTAVKLMIDIAASFILIPLLIKAMCLLRFFFQSAYWPIKNSISVFKARANRLRSP